MCNLTKIITVMFNLYFIMEIKHQHNGLDILEFLPSDAYILAIVPCSLAFEILFSVI